MPPIGERNQSTQLVLANDKATDRQRRNVTCSPFQLKPIEKGQVSELDKSQDRARLSQKIQIYSRRLHPSPPISTKNFGRFAV